MSKRSHGGSRGQILIVFVLALVAMIAMTGLIIDGGNAYANQRGTQNATDSAAEAGATVLMSNLLGAAKNDNDVLAAMNLAAADNNIKAFGPDDADHSVAFYTDVRGQMLTPAGIPTTSVASATRVGAGAIPPCLTVADCVNGVSSGVRALGRRTFNNYISSAVGMGQFGAQSDATAVAGYVAPCDASEGCAILPVTFATLQGYCEANGEAAYSTTPWTVVTPPYTSTNEQMLLLCNRDEGAFGWLDLGPDNTAQEILNPPNEQFYPKLWELGQPGNPNNVEDELNTYAGDTPGTFEPTGDPGKSDQTVLIPFFDGICNEDRPDQWLPPNYVTQNLAYEGPDPSTVFPYECFSNPPGGGANRYYHVPKYIGFILDQAYVQGNNRAACTSNPGLWSVPPLNDPNGVVGCLKGWIVRFAATGPVGASAPGGNLDSPLGVQLIR